VATSACTEAPGSLKPLADDLVDRRELVIVPTLTGHGRRLFTDGIDLRRLNLTKATRSATGCVVLGCQRP
jgi:dihydrofolate reductase